MLAEQGATSAPVARLNPVAFTTSLDEAYRTARETSLRLAGPEGIDRLLRANNVVALVSPTRPAVPYGTRPE